MADWVPYAVLAGAIALIAGGIWFFRRGSAAERAVTSLLTSIGVDHLRDVIIPDGTGGEIQIDCLIRTSHGLLALDINDTQGTVFAGDRLDTWSATHKGQRVTFANPISQLQARTEAIHLLARGVPLEGRILFVGEVDFPKGHPPQVSTVESLLSEFEAATRDTSAEHLDHHWQAIREAIISPSGG